MSRREYLGELEEVVLLAVARCEPAAYGMSIRKEIEEQSGRAVSIGAVYSVIDRLEDKGLLKRAAAPAGRAPDPRARRFFAVTKTGTAALEDTAALRDRLWRGLRLTRRSAE